MPQQTVAHVFVWVGCGAVLAGSSEVQQPSPLASAGESRLRGREAHATPWKYARGSGTLLRREVRRANGRPIANLRGFIPIGGPRGRGCAIQGVP